MNNKLTKIAALTGSLLLASAGAALAAPSMSTPGSEVSPQLPRPEASVEDMTPAQPGGAAPVEFTITNFRLEAPDLYLNKAELVRILQDGMGEKKTMQALNATLNELTRYCRANGYPAAAAYVPAQESTDGMITIRVIPGRIGEVKFDNRSKLKNTVAEGFTRALKPGDIIRTSALETTLYSISDVSGTRAVGVLSPGREFGTSDITVRIEDGKGENTVLYAENYGAKNTGRYRYGLQETLTNVGGTGAKLGVGTFHSNGGLHNYYINYEMLVGRGGTTLGLGYSRMNYEVGGTLREMDANGVADTISLFGRRPLYHYTNSGLTFSYGYDYRRLEDNLDAFGLHGKKHSHSAHIGLDGFSRKGGTATSYGVKVTTGNLGLDSDYSRLLNNTSKVEGSYTKGEANASVVQRLGHSADVMLKVSGQKATHNLDGSEEMYLGGANGVRAYPQGEGSGDEGVIGTVEARFYTTVPGLIFSTYYDAGHVKYAHDGSKDSTTNEPASGITLKGWGVGLAYTQPNDWFARLDYARRIGSDPNLSAAAKARGRVWFMLGKIW